MTALRAYIVALFTAISALIDRLRVRWYRRRRLPTVREALAAGRLPPGAPLEVIRAVDEPLFADPSSADYLSIPCSTTVVAGRPARVFRVASTRILPPPPRALEVLSPAPWNVEARRSMPPPVTTTSTPGERAASTPALVALPGSSIGVARAEAFGLDALTLSTRAERARVVDEDQPLLRARADVTPARAREPNPIGIARLASFGLDEDARPFAEAVPAPRRHPPRLPRARADFYARYVEPHPSEAFGTPVPPTFGERVEGWTDRFFVGTELGAIDTAFEWDLDEDLEEQMREVREQFGLRRDIDRHEFDPDELGSLGVDSDELPAAMAAFTGLSFEELEPEPWAPLKMRLEAPPPEVAPLTESADRQLAWLFSAIREHR